MSARFSPDYINPRAPTPLLPKFSMRSTNSTEAEAEAVASREGRRDATAAFPHEIINLPMLYLSHTDTMKCYDLAIQYGSVTF